MRATIEVLETRRLDGSGTVKAFVDLRIGAIALKGCKVVQEEGQRAWLAMPSIKTDHGWQNVIEITSKDLLQQITDVVLEAWRRAPERPPRREQPTRGQASWDRSRDHGDEP